MSKKRNKHALLEEVILKRLSQLSTDERKSFYIKLMAERGYVCVGEGGDELYFDKAVQH